jgi:hypothetical protein
MTIHLPRGGTLLHEAAGGDSILIVGKLVVSFKKDDGKWTEPASLGPTVNSPSMDLCPLLSPDGKYLFFLSQRGGENQAWWVEAGIIEKLRREALGR